MALSDAKVKAAKVPAGKSQDKLPDGCGMYLLVKPSGKYWRMDYRFAGKRPTLAIGVYPEVSLKQARKKRETAREQLSNNIDPNQAKKAEKRKMEAEAKAITFEGVAMEWYNRKLPDWAISTARHNKSRLDNYIFPKIGSVPIKDIEPFEVLAIARIAENHGHNELAHRIVRLCGQVFRYGVACGYVGSDCTRDLKGALKPVKTKHHPCLKTPKQIGELMRRIKDYDATFIVQCALRLTPYLFLRPGELRQMKWTWIDFETMRLTIPATVMKMRKPHNVALSPQAAAILKEVQQLTGDGCFVFAGRGNADCMSDGTINKCLRAMGYDTKTEQDAHGFRGLASTQLYEQGINPQWIELQLAHRYGSNV
ncbi:MAG: integrase arm-type DNA-binding domain-containing protein, partial [Ghiorsea sp.]